MTENLELEEGEIRLLMEALEALEKASANKLFSTTLMGLMLSRNKEETQRLMEESEREGKIKKAEQEMLEERIILVKAKLIRMKDAALVRQTMEEFDDRGN